MAYGDTLVYNIPLIKKQIETFQSIRDIMIQLKNSYDEKIETDLNPNWDDSIVSEKYKDIINSFSHHELNDIIQTLQNRIEQLNIILNKNIRNIHEGS